jgi:hypothetical protein
MTMPSATGTAPPESPVPAPRATKGIPRAAQTRTAAATCRVDVGSTTACGTARCVPSPSVSYVRSAVESAIRFARPTARSRSASRLTSRSLPGRLGGQRVILKYRNGDAAPSVLRVAVTVNDMRNVDPMSDCVLG